MTVSVHMLELDVCVLNTYQKNICFKQYYMESERKYISKSKNSFEYIKGKMTQSSERTWNVQKKSMEFCQMKEDIPFSMLH